MSARISAGLLLVGVLVFLLGLYDFFVPSDKKNSSAVLTKTSQTERDAAIFRARQTDGTYSFSTNFLPGIGEVDSPERIKEDFREQNPGAITN